MIDGQNREPESTNRDGADSIVREEQELRALGRKHDRHIANAPQIMKTEWAEGLEAELCGWLRRTEQ